MVGCWRRLEAAGSDVGAAREMVADSTGAERELAQAEVAQAEEDVARLEEECVSCWCRGTPMPVAT